MCVYLERIKLGANPWGYKTAAYAYYSCKEKTSKMILAKNQLLNKMIIEKIE